MKQTKCICGPPIALEFSMWPSVEKFAYPWPKEQGLCPPFGRRCLGATVSVLGLLGTGTFRHQRFGAAM